jgi:FAD/FMN-containing dehydrogenase
MKRRDLLAAGLSLAAVPFTGKSYAAVSSRVRPGDTAWPSDLDWASLNKTVNGRLAPVSVPPLDGPQAGALLANPYYIGDQPGLTQSSGWQDAWRSRPSAYAVAAESAADIAAAVRFAKARNLRLVIKGGGHSYHGVSSAPESLLIWTRRMADIDIHDAFTPMGSKAAPVPAVSVGAGCIWLHAYQAVSVGAGRYVQGGGCANVGVVGLLTGGGFGSFSKGFGLAASSLLEAEIVTADGQVRVVNAARSPDLFWALKGGGGGTFGVVTRMTLATHPLPETFGVVSGSIHAKSDEAYRALITRFVSLYAERLCNPHWGEQVGAGPDNTFQINMNFQGISAVEAKAAFQPLIDFANAATGQYEGHDKISAAAIPARRFWDAAFMRRVAGSAIVTDQRPDASPTDFWWSGDGAQVGAFWHAYESAWLPSSLLESQNQMRLADAWFAASRHWQVGFHFNKGLFGASDDVRAAARGTATNPQVADAFALAITASSSPSVYNHPAPDAAFAKDRADRVHAAIVALRAAAPGAGTYLNECSYFQPDWQTAFWGEHYSRLAAVKRRYDPIGLFTIHHGVGSEGWSADGFVRTG